MIAYTLLSLSQAGFRSLALTLMNRKSSRKILLIYNIYCRCQTVSVFLSAFTMLAISIDRYRAVIFPLRPRLTTRLAAVVIVTTWALAMIVSLPVAIFSRLTTKVNIIL
jgi:hypothetical protein